MQFTMQPAYACAGFHFEHSNRIEHGFDFESHRIAVRKQTLDLSLKTIFFSENRAQIAP